MQHSASAEPKKGSAVGNTAVTLPCVGEQGFHLTGAGTLCHFVTSPYTVGSHRKVIPINKASHTGRRNRLISQGIFYTNTAH